MRQFRRELNPDFGGPLDERVDPRLVPDLSACQLAAAPVDTLLVPVQNPCMSTKHYPKGLDGRERDADGQIREKRGDTLVRTLRKEYGDQFAEGYRSDAKLDTVRRQEGKSLSQLLKE